VVAFHIVIDKDALEFINSLPSKSHRIVVEKCKTLAFNPFPGQGDKEIIQRKDHEDIYRLHISRSYTAFYKIYKGGFRKTNQSKCLYTINIIIFDV